MKLFIRPEALKARKLTVEIVNAVFQAKLANAELVFIGRASSSDSDINAVAAAAADCEALVIGIHGARDSEVNDLIASGDVFLAIGTKGPGIPVLEEIVLRFPGHS